MPLSRRAALVPLLAVAALSLAAPATRAQPVAKREAAMAPTTVILVRHAERATEPANDPVITPAGEQRAQALAAALKDAGVQAIVTTQFQRTRLTAKPLADALGLAAEVVEARGATHPQEVARTVLSRHAGKTVVVVGHSNTVPAIAAALGAPGPGEIADTTYDNLFIVTVPASGGKVTIVKAQYGH